MAAASKTVRIVIVDDHPMMREGLAKLIAHEPGMEVCAEAETCGQAMECVARAKPDLVLADISLPDKNGLNLIKDMQALYPNIPVLVISMHDESLYAERVLKAGGRGYIMKQEGGKRLLEAMRQVLSGRVWVSEKIGARILDVFSGRAARTAGSPVESLTDREFEVFQLIGKGNSTREIASSLHVSVKTVEVHRVNIKQKLGMKTATELIRFAVQWVEER